MQDSYVFKWDWLKMKRENGNVTWLAKNVRLQIEIPDYKQPEKLCYKQTKMCKQVSWVTFQNSFFGIN